MTRNGKTQEGFLEQEAGEDQLDGARRSAENMGTACAEGLN